MSAVAETSGKAKIQLADLERRVGGEIGVSPWCTIGQDRIDAFADVTLDHQYIHVDPQAARGSPFGGTIEGVEAASWAAGEQEDVADDVIERLCTLAIDADDPMVFHGVHNPDGSTGWLPEDLRFSAFITAMLRWTVTGEEPGRDQ